MERITEVFESSKPAKGHTFDLAISDPFLKDLFDIHDIGMQPVLAEKSIP